MWNCKESAHLNSVWRYVKVCYWHTEARLKIRREWTSGRSLSYSSEVNSNDPRDSLWQRFNSWQNRVPEKIFNEVIPHLLLKTVKNVLQPLPPTYPVFRRDCISWTIFAFYFLLVASKHRRIYESVYAENEMKRFCYLQAHDLKNSPAAENRYKLRRVKIFTILGWARKQTLSKKCGKKNWKHFITQCRKEEGQFFTMTQ